LPKRVDEQDALGGLNLCHAKLNGFRGKLITPGEKSAQLRAECKTILVVFCHLSDALELACDGPKQLNYNVTLRTQTKTVVAKQSSQQHQRSHWLLRECHSGDDHFCCRFTPNLWMLRELLDEPIRRHTDFHVARSR
jgi:hypothetical protein